jgi:hypothetical protein
MGPPWRNEKHGAQWEVSLGRRDAARGAGSFAKPLRSKPVFHAIGTEDTLQVVRLIWRAKPESAHGATVALSLPAGSYRHLCLV